MNRKRNSAARDLISRIIDERDMICEALRADWQDFELFRKRSLFSGTKTWREGAYPDDQPVDFWPEGKTAKVLSSLYPSGVSELQVLFGRAVAESNRLASSAYFLPKLDAAYLAHKAFIEDARECNASGKNYSGLSTVAALEDSITAMAEVLDAIESATKPGGGDGEEINRKGDIVANRRNLVKRIIRENWAGKMTPARLRDLMNGTYAGQYAKISSDEYDRQDADNDLDAIGYRKPQTSNRGG